MDAAGLPGAVGTGGGVVAAGVAAGLTATMTGAEIVGIGEPPADGTTGVKTGTGPCAAGAGDCGVGDVGAGYTGGGIITGGGALDLVAGLVLAAVADGVGFGELGAAGDETAVA